MFNGKIHYKCKWSFSLQLPEYKLWRCEWDHSINVISYLRAKAHIDIDVENVWKTHAKSLQLFVFFHTSTLVDPRYNLDSQFTRENIRKVLINTNIVSVDIMYWMGQVGSKPIQVAHVNVGVAANWWCTISDITSVVVVMHN